MRSRLYRDFSGILLIVFLICLPAHAVSWFPFGPDGGDARAFAADPENHSHIYLGTTNGWVYQTLNGGAKWTRLARLGNRDDLVIDNILVDPANPKHLVAGAYVIADGGDIYVSNDGGTTWASEPQMHGQSVRSLASAPSNPRIMVAGTLEGVFRSKDDGLTWERISPKGSAEIHEVESLAIDPVDPNIIYAGTWHLPWKTADGGKTWANIKQGIIDDSDVFSIIVDPKQRNTVYLSACSGIYKSDNGGVRFQKVQGIPSTARRTRVLMQDPDHLNTVFAGTTEGLYRTFDAGKYWMQTTRSEVIVNDVYVDPTNPKHVLLATDRSGVLASDDGGDSFAPSNTGFSAQHITSFAQDAAHPAVVYVGVVNDKEFGGVFVSRTGGLSWSLLNTGLDGRDVLSLIQAPDGSIVAGTERGIYRLDNGIWHRAGASAEPQSRPQTHPVVASQRNTRRKRSGRAHSSRKVQPTRAPEAPLRDLDGTVYQLARVGDNLFAATSDGLLRSDTSGVNWIRVTGVPVQDFQFVSAEKELMALADFSVFEISADGGKTWQKASLPTQLKQVTALCVDGRGAMWVADRDAVYVSEDRGANWHSVPNLNIRNVNSLYFDSKAERVLVASGSSTQAYSVELPSMRLQAWDTGWNLRFVRPVGDHLIGATMFDGIVVQPRWVDSSLVAKEP